MGKNVKLVNINGEIIKEVAFNKNLLVDKISKQAMFDVVVAELAAQRQGTHSTLTKGEVRGGGKKPYMQKHTGNARQGSIRNPQWVGGGIVFGPKPGRNYKKKVNNKVSRLAFKSALTEKLNNDSLILLEDVSLNKPKTKTIINLLNKLNLDKKVLFILGSGNDNLIKSIRNINKVSAKLFNQASVKDIMNAKNIIIQNNAYEALGKVYC